MSGGDALYQETIKALARDAHGAGSLPAPDGSTEIDNPLCGDRVRIEITRDAGRISALAHKTRGCLLCRASAAVLGLRAPGHDAHDIARARQDLANMLGAAGPPPADWPELAAFVPASAHRSRHDCVLLPFDALLAALRA